MLLFRRYRGIYKECSKLRCSVLSSPSVGEKSKPNFKKIREYVDYNVRMTKLEMIEKLASEAKLKQCLSRRELEIRGLALFGLVIDPSYPKKTAHDGSIEIRLNRIYDYGFDFKRVFRKGKLIVLCLDPKGDTKDEFSFQRLSLSNDKESTFNAMIEDAYEESIVLHFSPREAQKPDFLRTIRSLSEYHHTRVFLVKRSEKDLFTQSIYRLQKSSRRKELKKGTSNGVNILSSFDRSANEEEEKLDQCVKPPGHMPRDFHGSLDDSKRIALEKASACPPIHIIHGPPGTGKTTTLTSIILSAVANDERVLVLAPSHAACDALTMAIYSQLSKLEPEIKAQYFAKNDLIVRQAKRQRLVVPFVEQFLPEMIYGEYLSDDVRKNISDLWRKLSNSKSLKDSEILRALQKNTISLDKEYKNLLNKSKSEASIFITTIASVTNEMYNRHPFDLVCIDEAGFVSQGNSFLHLLRASRLILCGDHCQLPPITFCQESADNGYEVSAMERLVKIYPDSVTLLSTQYRSNSLISEWSSKYFYGGRLKSCPSVARIVLSDLVSSNSEELTEPVTFIDTSGMGYNEEQDNGSEELNDGDKSIVNLNEAFLVEMIVKKYLKLGVPQKDIGVICPYWSQVSVIRTLLWENEDFYKVGVHTVDSYQGSEKEMIIISFVRSNPHGDIGFLKETRRINVSLTRAKRRLVIIGDAQTLSHDPALGNFVQFCRENNAIVSASEYPLE